MTAAQDSNKAVNRHEPDWLAIPKNNDGVAGGVINTALTASD
jgi:hypothetical protein